MDLVFVMTCLSTLIPSAYSTKPFSGGQRIFTDAQAIDFIDPSKHGFHIVLREDFVGSHLQPVHAPTVFASAIALQSSTDNLASQITNRSSTQSVRTSANGQLRATKTLYPENGNPEDGLLDGRTIKLLELREKTWYYVCVEFESNLRRHELVTGLCCQLKRTLDKFGQSAESAVNEVELLEVTDRSVAIRLTVSTDFPLFIHAYLNYDDISSPTGATPPTQTFSVHPSAPGQNQRLVINFGPFLQPDTSYGRVCVIEEPKVETYTAMGRAIRLVSENCYFSDLKTKPAIKVPQGRKALHDSPHSPQAQVRSHYVGPTRGSSSTTITPSIQICLATMIILYFRSN